MAKWNASGREPGEKKMKRTFVIAEKFLIPFPRSSAAMATTIMAWMIGGADGSEPDEERTSAKIGSEAVRSDPQKPEADKLK